MSLSYAFPNNTRVFTGSTFWQLSSQNLFPKNRAKVSVLGNKTPLRNYEIGHLKYHFMK